MPHMMEDPPECTVSAAQEANERARAREIDVSQCSREKVHGN